MSLRTLDFETACDILGVKNPVLSEIKDHGAGKGLHVAGFGFVEMRDESGELSHLDIFENKITDIGDQYYAKTAAGISPRPAQVTGMKLGKSTTAPQKSGVGSYITSYTIGVQASKAIDGTHPTATDLVPGTRIEWKTSWTLTEVISTGWAEVALVNTTIATDTAGTEAGTIARSLFASAFDKDGTQTLAVVWSHLILGA